MKKFVSLSLCILLLQFSWANSHMHIENAPRIDKEGWTVDDAGIKKTAVTMLIFGALFSAATVILCVFIPGQNPAEATSGGSSGGDAGGGIAF